MMLLWSCFNFKHTFGNGRVKYINHFQVIECYLLKWFHGPKFTFSALVMGFLYSAVTLQVLNLVSSWTASHLRESQRN